MNPLVSAQQAYFFNHHGYIEFEAFLSSPECDALQEHVDAALLARCKKSPSRIPQEQQYANGRDLWREKDFLKNLVLSKRFTSLAFGLTNKPTLSLGFDQWIPPLDWPKSVKAKDLFSIQGLSSVYFIRLSAPVEGEILAATFQREPGLIPLPTQRGHLLAVQPQLLLNLPRLAAYQPSLYCVGYAAPHAVYFHNPEDPCNHSLKAFGYNFGDRLIPAHHPLIRS